MAAWLTVEQRQLARRLSGADFGPAPMLSGLSTDARGGRVAESSGPRY